MQAMSMIEMGTQTSEMIAPAKPVEPQGKQFGKVLREQSQAERPEQAEVKPKQMEQQAMKQEVKTLEQPAQDVKLDTPIAEQGQAVAEQVAELAPKLQQTVIDLMKVIAGGQTPELVEEFGSSEELLQQLVQQLEGADLQAEQVLAGIDFSALTEQLQDLTAEADPEQFTQLVEQLGAELEVQLQLSSAEPSSANAELAAAMMTTDSQGKEPKLVENLAQARQILQKVINSVSQQQTSNAQAQEQVVAETEETAEQLLFTEDSAEEIDPRFAGLLKPRSEQPQLQQQQSLRQRAQAEVVQPQAKTAETANVVSEPQAEVAEVADFAKLVSQQPKQGVENLVQQLAGQQAQPNLTAAEQQAAKVLPQTPTVQLPSGQQVAESQIFDQVVTKFVGSQNGESGRMVLRLQPAELGSLKIELQVEGDRVRANLHAQSIQVQEVLERNLPQLRNALAEQGLKIDHFNVEVDRNADQQGQFEQMAEQQQQRQHGQQPAGWQQPVNDEEQIVPLAHLMQNGGGGISLHV